MPSSLRIALVSGGTLFAEHRVRPGRALRIGDGRGAAFTCPGVDAPRHELATVHRDHAILTPSAGMAVRIERDGTTRSGRPSDAVEVLPGDRVTLTVGATSIYAWWVEDGPAMPRGVAAMAWALGAAAILSLWAHGLVWLLALSTVPDVRAALDLDIGPRVARLLVEPPPEPIAEVPEPDVATDESMAAAAGGEAGEVGPEDAEPDETVLPDHDGPLVEAAPQVELGRAMDSAIATSGALTSVFGHSDAFASNFGDDFATAGQGDTLVLGPGSNGLSLRGPGTGGGGDGPGRVAGIGEIDTGSGQGDRAALGTRDERVREGRVTMSDPQVAGFLEASHIRRVVQRHGRGLRRCYESSLQQNHDLAGRVTVTWTVGRDGRVQNASAGENTLADRRVESCVLDEVRRMQFDQPDGGLVVVTFPFTFRSASP